MRLCGHGFAIFPIQCDSSAIVGWKSREKIIYRCVLSHLATKYTVRIIFIPCITIYLQNFWPQPISFTADVTSSKTIKTNYLKQCYFCYYNFSVKNTQDKWHKINNIHLHNEKPQYIHSKWTELGGRGGMVQTSELTITKNFLRWNLFGPQLPMYNNYSEQNIHSKHANIKIKHLKCEKNIL